MNLSGTNKAFYLVSGAIVLLSIIVPLATGAGEIERTKNTTAINNADVPREFRLNDVISYALAHNPGLRNAGKDIQIEQYEIDTAQANRLPRIDLGGGVTRYRYDTPLTPLVITPPISA